MKKMYFGSMLYITGFLAILVLIVLSTFGNWYYDDMEGIIAFILLNKILLISIVFLALCICGFIICYREAYNSKGKLVDHIFVKKSYDGYNMIFSQVNKWGYRLDAIVDIDEEDLPLDINKYKPITSSLLYLENNGKYVIGYHANREQWEFPGGTIEEGETPRDCVIREVYEEVGQQVSDVKFIALAELYNSRQDVTEYLAIYHTVMDRLDDFAPTEEMTAMKTWNLQKNIGDHDFIGREILQYCQKARMI